MSSSIISGTDRKSPINQSLLSEAQNISIYKKLQSIDIFLSLALVYLVVMIAWEIWSVLHLFIMIFFRSSTHEYFTEFHSIEIWNKIFNYYIDFGVARSLYGLMQISSFAFIYSKRNNLTIKALLVLILLLFLSLIGLALKQFVVFYIGQLDNGLIEQVFHKKYIKFFLIRYSLAKNLFLFGVDFGLFLFWETFSVFLAFKIRLASQKEQ